MTCRPLCISLFALCLGASAQAQQKPIPPASKVAKAALPAESPIKVEWYPPEMERSEIPGYAKVIISGRTGPQSKIKIDDESITLIRGLSNSKAPDNPRSRILTPIKKNSEQGQSFSNMEGYFEVSMDFPQGLIQLPIEITAADKTEKVFLITFEVSLEKVKMKTEVSKNKPPAARKVIRLWAGMGATLQKYSQDVGGATNVSFQNSQVPSLLLRAGYWGNTWGFDFFFRDAPGKIDDADQPFKIKSSQYHWQTLEARGHYQLSRGNKSRMAGLPSQWQLLFGVQDHKMPFLNVNLNNEVVIRQNELMMATVGAGLLLGQERDWSYEFDLEYQTPLSAGSADGNSFSVSNAMALDLRVGANYKFTTDWRIGLFTYIQSHSYSFSYTDKEQNRQYTGKQSLFYSTFDIQLGYEF